MNKKPKDEKEITTVYIERGFKDLAKERGIKISDITNSALRAVFEVNSTISALKKKQNTLIIELTTINAEIDRRETIEIEALTKTKIMDERRKEIERKVDIWIPIRLRKYRQEGKAPEAIVALHAKKIGISNTQARKLRRDEMIQAAMKKLKAISK